VQEALKLARVIAGKSPVAVGVTNRILLHSWDHGIADNLEYTAALMTRVRFYLFLRSSSFPFFLHSSSGAGVFPTHDMYAFV
jgi:delta(3,5)-delta(2,4)-dienoyl-CoA isomerase